jgi:four helix bundle protein
MTKKPNDPQGSAGDGGDQPPFDLEERTALFGEMVIDFCRSLKEDCVTRPLISQLVRSGTSVGANYGEADEAVSRKEFMNKIGTCKKESKETRHWVRMIVKACPDKRNAAVPVWKEANELLLIFAAIYRKK